MFVLPDEEGPGAILGTRSSKSLLVGSTFLPVPPLPPDTRAALCSGRLVDADGDVDLAGIRPGHGAPSARSPTSGIEGLLVAHHGESHPVGALSQRAPDHALCLPRASMSLA